MILCAFDKFHDDHDDFHDDDRKEKVTIVTMIKKMRSTLRFFSLSNLFMIKVKGLVMSRRFQCHGIGFQGHDNPESRG